MDLYALAPVVAALDIAYSLVTALASLIAPIAPSFATSLAIVAITLIVRAALIPVGRAQAIAELTRRRLAPRLQELQRRYKSNPELLRRKTIELYAAEKASPVAGCLPALIQAPVVSIVYGLFILTTIDGHPNALLTAHLLDAPLGSSFVNFLNSFEPGPAIVVYLVLLSMVAVVAGLSRHQARRSAPPLAEGLPPGMSRMQGVINWLPFLTVLFAAVVPMAATIYLAVTTTWTLIEREILRRVVHDRDLHTRS